jgi:phospholipase/carboxylesterase
MDFSLYHLVREPKIRKDKNPLLLLLHGYGSNEEDLFSFASELPQQYYVISARAPYGLPPYGYAWYAINFDADENKFSDLAHAKLSRDLVLKFIDELVANYPIDANDITLVGFSQGCILSYAAALSKPEKIQRVVAMSGYFNKELAVDNFEKNDFSNLKFFISHGMSDQVVPVDWARKAKPELDKLGIDSVYKEYPVGHGVAPQNFYDVMNWLETTAR